MRQHIVFAALVVAWLGASSGCERDGEVTDEGPAVEYYAHVDEVVAKAPELARQRKLRVHGYVVAGSISKRVGAPEQELRFRLTYDGKEIEVIHRGSVPDMFRDEVETVAMGRLVSVGGAGWRLESTELLTKCPSKYDGVPRSVPAP